MTRGRENITDLEEVLPRVEAMVATLRVPVADLIAVQGRDPYRVLVAGLLSSRTRDEVTVLAARRLFAAAPDLPALSRLSVEEITTLIRPVGFFRSKADFLARLPAALQEGFGGRVPATVAELIRLPGVGRKTANLVVAVAFRQPAICVDTHVHRIMNIWGYVTTATPLATEMALRNRLPGKYWLRINEVLVAFGQGICRPIAPHCDRCLIVDRCPQLGVVPRKTAVQMEKGNGKGMMRLMSWNVNGLRAAAQKGFLTTVQTVAPDILALQEVKAFPEQLPEELKNIDGYRSYWFPARRKGYSGVGVYARREPLAVHYGMGSEEFDQEGRVLTLEYGEFFLVNVYFPNSAEGLVRLTYKLNFNAGLRRYVEDLREKKAVVVCGDFNVAHREIDLANPRQNEKNAGFTPEERAWMDDFLAAGYVDTFRMFNQEPGQYTWWSYRFNARARNIGWRIDYFCVDRQNQHRVSEAAILADIAGSDHCPVLLSYQGC